MPVVPLEAVTDYPPPQDHADPANHDDVERAVNYDIRLTTMYQHGAQVATLERVTNARLHAHDTCSSFLAGNLAPAQPQQVLNLAVLQNALQPLHDELAAIRERVDDGLTELRQAIGRQDGKLDLLQELAIDSSVKHARSLNQLRDGGHIMPLLSVRLADGRLPVPPRPRLSSIAVINGLNRRQAMSYARGYALLDNFDGNPTIEQLRQAIAYHVGAIPMDA